MNCADCKLQISAYLDGALSLRESRLVLRHADVCDDCRDFLAEQERITAWMRSEDLELPLPDRVWEQIAARIDIPAVASAKRGWWERALSPRWAYPLAASLLLAVVSGSLVVVPERENAGLLAQLNAYEVNVTGNPFLTEPTVDNPFFEPLAEIEGNPFGQMRSQK